MCGKIRTVLLIFVVLNCSMARYNGRLHCIVGVLPTCYKRKAATYFYPRVARGLDLVEDFGIHFSEMSCDAEVKADISSAVLNFSGVSSS